MVKIIKLRLRNSDNWINSVLNCEAYYSFEGVASDHWILTAKICLSLRNNTTQTTKTTHLNWSVLNNRDIKDKYKLTQRNKCDTHQEIPDALTPNDEYEDFVNAHIEAAPECIPIKLRAKHRVLWETLTAKKQRDNVKIAFLFNKRNPTYVITLKYRKAWSELIKAYKK